MVPATPAVMSKVMACDMMRRMVDPDPLKRPPMAMVTIFLALITTGVGNMQNAQYQRAPETVELDNLSHIGSMRGRQPRRDWSCLAWKRRRTVGLGMGTAADVDTSKRLRAWTLCGSEGMASRF